MMLILLGFLRLLIETLNQYQFQMGLNEDYYSSAKVAEAEKKESRKRDFFW